MQKHLIGIAIMFITAAAIIGYSLNEPAQGEPPSHLLIDLVPIVLGLALVAYVWEFRAGASARLKWGASGGVLVAVVLYCAVHVFFGGTGGLHMCWKYGWTPRDTFVDLDSFGAGRPPSAKVEEAVRRCHL